MFQFSRPTMWIIINVTMLMVILLNYFGSNNEAPTSDAETVAVGEVESTVSAWPVAQLQPSCSDLKCTLALPGSNQVQVSFVADQQPTQQPTVPLDLPLVVNQQGGFFVVTSQLTSRTDIAAAIDFFERWLPAGGQVMSVFSGPVSEPWAERIVEHAFEFAGASEPFSVEPAASLGVLTSPRFGDDDQLAFLMWIEVLRSRLAGYRTLVRWDHRRAQSVVLFNATLSADTFFPVTEDELSSVLGAYQIAAGQAERSGEQIHRFLQTAMVYNLPFEFFTNQSERLSQVSLTAVNRMRDQSLGQITQP